MRDRDFPRNDGPQLTRTRNCLRNALDGPASIPITPEEVADLSAIELLEWPNFGLKCVSDINDWLGRHGLGPLRDTPLSLEDKERALLARLKAKYEQ